MASFFTTILGPRPRCVAAALWAGEAGSDQGPCLRARPNAWLPAEASPTGFGTSTHRLPPSHGLAQPTTQAPPRPALHIPGASTRLCLGAPRLQWQPSPGAPQGQVPSVEAQGGGHPPQARSAQEAPRTDYCASVTEPPQAKHHSVSWNRSREGEKVALTTRRAPPSAPTAPNPGRGGRYLPLGAHFRPCPLSWAMWLSQVQPTQGRAQHPPG